MFFFLLTLLGGGDFHFGSFSYSFTVMLLLNGNYYIYFFKLINCIHAFVNANANSDAVISLLVW